MSQQQIKKLQKKLIHQIADRQPLLLAEIKGWLSQQLSNFTASNGSASLNVLEVYPQLLREIHENESWIGCYKGGEVVKDPIAEDPNQVLIRLTKRGNTYVQTGKNPPSRHPSPGIGNRSAEEQVESPQQSAKLKIPDLVETPPSKKPRKDLTEKRARDEISRSIQGRRGQQDFRQKLLTAYHRKCAITSSTIESLLEAAHIHPYCDGGAFNEANGILLRADIHTLFDLGLIAINVYNMTVVIHPSLNDTEYGMYANRLITLPSDPKHHPNKAALDQHRCEAGIAIQLST